MLVALSATLAGCGGQSSPAPSGAAVFAHNCSGCHSLIGNESLHRQGGDLVRYRFSRADLLEFAREMPLRKPLSARELTAVVDYILLAERGASGGRH